jgi:hypothetical protein
MKPLSRFLVPAELEVPFVPVGIELDAGLAILTEIGGDLREENGTERCFKVQVGEASVAIYTRGQCVDSVWYDDPLGRWSVRGKARKIELHLARYAPLSGWSVWNENAWMKYWKHEAAPVGMVYGIHMDVIRFNLHRDA